MTREPGRHLKGKGLSPHPTVHCTFTCEMGSQVLGSPQTSDSPPRGRRLLRAKARACALNTGASSSSTSTPLPWHTAGNRTAGPSQAPRGTSGRSALRTWGWDLRHPHELPVRAKGMSSSLSTWGAMGPHIRLSQEFQDSQQRMCHGQVAAEAQGPEVLCHRTSWPLGELETPTVCSECSHKCRTW